eukprot:CAMPEP_0113564672 /NCGR_PEP_ID=MMETSP0015_2-20120614/21750_1 /TAXON_ID=2838 /ORGANISM="Odontella" /LENGTH=1222 /DNA_ID=CAMNT_0000466781 /DNA_START=16 /DNA_END=3680 /DNA_ORIENTATION=- /assembly_acc=CAM_ASM_000160
MTAPGNRGGTDDPVVSHLSRSSHPYSSVACSPDRRHAVAAAKDALRVLSVSPSGLQDVRTLRISQHFQPTSSAVTSSSNGGQQGGRAGGRVSAEGRSHQGKYGDVRDAFGLPKAAEATTGTTLGVAAGGGMNITVTDVAWSLSQSVVDADADPSVPMRSVGAVSAAGDVEGGLDSNNSIPQKQPQVPLHSFGKSQSSRPSSPLSPSLLGDDSLVAAAGSNGVVVVWNAQSALLGAEAPAVTHSTRHHFLGGGGKATDASSASSSAVIGQPEAVLADHSRAVNRLAWHPTGRHPGLLLTGSQDGTVKLWDRRASQPSVSVSSSQPNEAPRQLRPHGGIRSWGLFGGRQSISGISSALTHPSHRTSGGAGSRGVPTAPVCSWRCVSTFQLKSDAVRDIQWNPFIDDIFAAVTDSGSLAVYDVRVLARPFIKVAAHAGEATTVDWHPTRRYVLATGGGRDRSVKVWDLESGLNLSKPGGDEFIKANAGSKGSDLSGGSGDVDDAASTGTGGAVRNISAVHGTLGSSATSSASLSSFGRGGFGVGPSVRSRGAVGATELHTLSISAPVTRLKWRPPAEAFSSRGGSGTDERTEAPDRHDTMMAVSTAPISGASAGGFGSLSLWSYRRPFMPLSVVEGHKEGAVTNFIWIDTPDRTLISDGHAKQMESSTSDGKKKHLDRSPARHGGKSKYNVHEKISAAGQEALTAGGGISSDPSRTNTDQLSVSMHEIPRRSPLEVRDSRRLESDDKGSSRSDPHHPEHGWVEVSQLNTLAGTWQHVLSVGRDGRCLLQSFARGERPISQVPPSALSVANMSPFQPGFGSIQVVSVHQSVPDCVENDFELTGLRRDAGTIRAPGVFREVPSNLAARSHESRTRSHQPRRAKSIGGQNERVPSKPPNIVVSFADRGDLDELGSPSSPGSSKVLSLSPEVVHLSRFADQYQLWCNLPNFPSKASLCWHNARVADHFNSDRLTHMWKMLASLLEGTGCDSLALMDGTSNAMAFLLVPALRSLLLERADAGDVQTCVAVCEVMQIISPPSSGLSNSAASVASSMDAAVLIPGLDLELIREWYLSYISMLQQMCLFSHASTLIRACNDPVVGALNQQSTTVHESCPHCYKPLQGITTFNESDGSDRKVLTTQRVCSNCRRRVGLCFLCHEPVKGMFVWCPGCGHGGHLEHAIEWFGGEDSGGAGGLREFCPTGCGHKCNLSQIIMAFPRTNSLSLCMPCS